MHESVRWFEEYESSRITLAIDLLCATFVMPVATNEFIVFEKRWTGAYIFENEWQSFRTRNDRDLELKSVPHSYPKPGRYTVAVKVIDIFGNDTMTLVPVTVG